MKKIWCDICGRGPIVIVGEMIASGSELFHLLDKMKIYDICEVCRDIIVKEFYKLQSKMTQDFVAYVNLLQTNKKEVEFK